MKIDVLLSLGRIGILGFGKDSKDFLNFLISREFVGEIFIFDMNAQCRGREEFSKKNFPNIVFIVGEDAFSDLQNCDVYIKSPGVARRSFPAIEQAFQEKKLTSGLEIFLQNVRGRVIGITGTKGKSTCTKLLYEMCRGEFHNKVSIIGNYGVPAITSLGNDDVDCVYIAELSSYMLEDLRGMYFEFGLLINIFPDHLDYHGGYANYILAKKNIVSLSRNSYGVHSFDEDGGGEEKKKYELFLENFSRGNISLGEKNIICPETLRGVHNGKNIFFVLRCAEFLNLGFEAVEFGIKNFSPLAHRLEAFSLHERVWIDDAISTTPDSTMAGIEVYRETLGGIILGGVDRGVEYEEFIDYLSGIESLTAIVFFPDSGKRMFDLVKEKQLYGRFLNIKILFTEDMDEAVEFLYSNTEKGVSILLSTASASYNLFSGYEQQGDVFKSSVGKISAV